MGIASIAQDRMLEVGDVFVSHRIEGLAGRGGMGVVYRATDLELDRLVALKVIAPALAREPDFRTRFVAESKAAASIEHPHVIPVYYAGEREGVLFIVMRYVDGPDLRGLVRAHGRLDPERAAHLVAQVGRALDAAHARGLVHRDVKPANVLLGAYDHAYLTDFGLTQRDAGGGVVSRGGWVGTPGFVAPEQIRGERVDARTDVYALGCVLVHALTGGSPYMRESDAATLQAHLSDPPPVDRVPAAFAAVVERALAKDPAMRFPSAGDLGRAALAAARDGAPPGSERNVARGAAAPEGLASRSDPPAHEGETQPSPTYDGARSHRGRAGHGPKLAAVGVLLAACVLAAVQLAGNPEPVRSSPPASRPEPTPVADVVRVGDRPDAIAIADGGRVWALSSASGEIHVLDGITGVQHERIDIGASATGTAIAAGFGDVWAMKESTRSLIRIGAGSSHRHVDTAVRIDGAGSPDRIAIGNGAVWVAVRNSGGGDDTIVGVDPDEPDHQRRLSVPAGTRDIAAGRGSVWVTNALRRTVTRIDAANTLDRTVIPVGFVPDAIAITPRAVWITALDERAVFKLDPASGRWRRVALDVQPTGIKVGGGSVWVTARFGRLRRIDPGALRDVDTVVAIGVPRAVGVAGSALWLVVPGSDVVQRISFMP